jgi:hypothetical protein
MKTNQIISRLLVGSIILLALSCDKIDDPYKGIAGGGGEVVGDSIWSDTTHNFRKMYVEEFTGHTCFNCPRETKKLINWSETDYKGKMVMTSIHWGGFAEPNNDKGYPDDWRCEAGREINDKFGVTSNPSILVNRLQTTALGPGQWRSELDKQVATVNTPTLKLTLLNIRNGSKNENKLIVRGIALSNITGQHTIGLMYVTDSVIAPQMLYDRSRDTSYAHRHMLRGSLGPSIGNSFIESELNAGDTVIKEFNFQPEVSWDTTHLFINAFVRSNDTEEIIQSEEVKLTK